MFLLPVLFFMSMQAADGQCEPKRCFETKTFNVSDAQGDQRKFASITTILGLSSHETVFYVGIAGAPDAQRANGLIRSVMRVTDAIETKERWLRLSNAADFLRQIVGGLPAGCSYDSCLFFYDKKAQAFDRPVPTVFVPALYSSLLQHLDMTKTHDEVFKQVQAASADEGVAVPIILIEKEVCKEAAHVFDYYGADL